MVFAVSNRFGTEKIRKQQFFFEKASFILEKTPFVIDKLEII